MDCNHKDQYQWNEYDARGIYLVAVCEKCVDKSLSVYRSDVLTDPNYWADEDIEKE